MSKLVKTGTWQTRDSQLALYRYHVDASDEELREYGISRDEVLALARSLGDGGYGDTELGTIAEQMIRAYIAGRNHKTQ